MTINTTLNAIIIELDNLVAQNPKDFGKNAGLQKAKLAKDAKKVKKSDKKDQDPLYENQTFLTACNELCYRIPIVGNKGRLRAFILSKGKLKMLLRPKEITGSVEITISDPCQQDRLRGSIKVKEKLLIGECNKLEISMDDPAAEPSRIIQRLQSSLKP
ncbi:MAG: hypothetical protein PHE27_06160 [Alphaproteobacteria bacterium]|nr:hypothetical protein [Alphaproteobacteria bacterium]